MNVSEIVFCKGCRRNKPAAAQCRACDKPLCERCLLDLWDRTELAERIRLIPQVERLLIAGAIRDVLCQGCSFDQAKEFPELLPGLLKYWNTLPRVQDAEIMREISA